VSGRIKLLVGAAAGAIVLGGCGSRLGADSYFVVAPIGASSATTTTSPEQVDAATRSSGPWASGNAPAQPVPTDPSPPPAAPSHSCQAALAYLTAHAAPGFVSLCPHDAQGHQAMTTCTGAPGCIPGTMFIYIADPCPAAYMNEASNSWVLIGKSDAGWDPYGYCGEAGNPYG